jgi:hypothetical protein
MHTPTCTQLNELLLLIIFGSLILLVQPLHTHILLLQGGRRTLVHAEVTRMASIVVRKRSRGKGRDVVYMTRRQSGRADMPITPSARRISSRSLSMHRAASSAGQVMRRQAGRRVPCCRKSKT